MKRLRFHIRVQKEVDEAVRWYDNQSAGLGGDFYDKFSDALSQIASHPEGFAFWLRSNTIRRAKLRRFPYDLLFEIRPDAVRIVCLRHEKRHPGFGMGRS
jgi:plasmid stabilization system protein ParE